MAKLFPSTSDLYSLLTYSLLKPEGLGAGQAASSNCFNFCTKASGLNLAKVSARSQ